MRTLPIFDTFLSVVSRAERRREEAVMALEFRYGRNGELIQNWYGRYEVNGKRHTVDLQVKIDGTPPPSLSLRDKGNDQFELSRQRAKDKLEEVIERTRGKQDAAHLVERIYEIKTGEKVKSVELEDLSNQWEHIPRRRKPNARYAEQCKSVLIRFVTYVRRKFPKVEELGQVTRQVAQTFLEWESERGVTAKTWNDTLKLLRATCKYLLPAGSINPFTSVPTRDTDTVFRKPFTPEELGAIMDAARTDDFVRPIIVTGICTAMRRGDCCLLKWRDVDLKKRFITVKTGKTGVTVRIPIFPMLYDELAARPAGEGFVFPEQAQMYQENPDGITYRVKGILFAAFREPAKEGAPALPEVTADEARARGLNYVASLGETAKAARMRQVFELYMDGKPLGQVAEAMQVSKGTVWGHLNEIEFAAKCRIMRGRHEEPSVVAAIRADTSLLRISREGSSRLASVRDFHSFRVTWVTLALTAGVPLELVQKVTGHKTTDIVLKHYFQPGQEDFRRTLQAAMPKLLMNGQKSPKEEVLEICQTVTSKTWKKDVARIVVLVEGM